MRTVLCLGSGGDRPRPKNHFRLMPGMRGYLMISSRPLLAYPIRLSLRAPRSA